jgi:hypothetical protein
VISLRDAGRLDDKLAATALIDLASKSREMVGASLLRAVAVRAVPREPLPALCSPPDPLRP